MIIHNIPAPTMLFVVAIVSYLLGSLNFALLISRIFSKDDIRKYGSGNAGMTNMLRTYGKKAAIATTAGDFLKAIAAISLARWVFATFGVNPELAGISGTFLYIPGADMIDPGYIAGAAALLGHVFPIYFGFRGGKGVVTTAAVLLAINPLIFLLTVAIFVPLAFITRIVSLASVLGVIFFPAAILTMGLIRGYPPNLWQDVLFCLVISGIVLIKHKENIKRLLAGTEHKFSRKK